MFNLVIVLLVMDLLFFLFVPSAWMAYEDDNTVWNGLHGLHGFAIFCSVLIAIGKVHMVIPRSLWRILYTN